ncbi:MAG: protease modulator HflK [Lentisphaeria bacterium]|nr:protease modulator HflK [Lentisphaeria bacterium]
MEIDNDLRAAVDRARLMTRLSVIAGVLTLVLLILTVALGFIKPDFAGSDTFALTLLPLLQTLLFSAGAAIYGILAGAAAREEEEKALLQKRKDNRALNTDEDVRFTAGRTFANYRRFAPYVLSLLALLILGALLYFFGAQWSYRGENRIPPANALHAALVATILMLLSAFAGAFYTGQGRARDFGWLKAVGAWLTASSAVFLCAAAVAICNRFDLSSIDLKVAWVLFWLMALLGGELLLNMIIEFYRPRSIVESKPIFESRLLALFTEPGGIMRNLADTLDYQFGFRVSSTWIYGFVERALFPAILCWAAVLWLSTSIYEVGPEDVGIRERFGRVVSTTPLQPGVYLELPRPFGNIATYSCSRIREVKVGAKSDVTDASREPEVTLWTVQHREKGENEFIVAVEPRATANDRREAISVALVSLDMPVQYCIRESQLMDYAYGNREPAQILRRIAEEVTTDYLASCSLMDLMAKGRGEASRIIRDRIQKRADEEKLGIEIIGVPLLGVHPPVQPVAPAFQEVFGAMEQKEAMILAAEAYSEGVVPEARATAQKIEADALAYRYRTAKVAEAEAARFAKQLIRYQAMPAMFMLSSRLELLERDAAKVRKFVIGKNLKHEVFEMNFEEKERLDLIDADLGKTVEQ